MGERQLVLIGLALAQGGRLIVLDEPTVHLDLRHQVAVLSLLTDLASGTDHGHRGPPRPRDGGALLRADGVDR